LLNLYGCSEVAADVTEYEVARGVATASVPIGRPIANSAIYLLDGDLNPVPIGARGEIYAAGAVLARGYLHRPDLTAERFVPNPFDPSGGTRLYRTGDIARHLADGAIEYLGRADRQIKLRGYRIEVQEIER